MVSYFYIAGTIIFTVYGQLIMKWRMNGIAALPEPTIEKIVFLIKLVFDPYIFSGFVAAFIASLFWMAAMTKFEISNAYPIIVGGLAVLTSIFAIFFLKESFTLIKIIALLLIVSGVYLLSNNS
ncbi:MAG: EamA family transporter [gamma proteobacterium symbiont of Taylorina sp.]|nr:EamA family transporter [gamma proteobacterium symbiont of Taylorina sp.]